MKPLDQATMSQRATDEVRDAILDGTFPPGSSLRETQLADELGISRAPVREALLALVDEGLVVRVPFKGTFVAEVSPDVALEIAALRKILEPYAAELASSTLRTKAGRKEFADCVATLEKLIAAGDRLGALEAHLALHRAVYRASGNKLLLQIWDSWAKQLRLYLAVHDQELTRIFDVAGSHRNLMELLEAGDVDAIRHGFSDHVVSLLPSDRAEEPETQTTNKPKRKVSRR